MVVSDELNFVMGGDSVADSLDTTFNSRVRHPGSMIAFLHQTVDIASGSPALATGSCGGRQLKEVRSLGFLWRSSVEGG